MHLITKRLELSQTLAKIMADIKRLEDDVGKVLMGRPPPPVIHNKQELQKDIDDLKVGGYTISLPNTYLYLSQSPLFKIENLFDFNNRLQELLTPVQ